MLMSDFKKFIKLSRALGRRVDFVQGAGGNVSVKIGDKMFIKASGWRLADISHKNGLAIVDYKKIARSKNFNFSDYPATRPSMEAGFHSFLRKYVVHTHSIYSNLVACAVNGEKIWQEICCDNKWRAVWIDYQNPGEFLAAAIKKELRKFKRQFKITPEIILLQNHGLIIHGDNLERVFNLHNVIQEEIQRFFNIKKLKFQKKFKFSKLSVTNFQKNILFPDQVVFGLVGEKNSFFKENLFAWQYIVENAKKCDLKLRYLSQKDVIFIKNMESEKYRKSLLKK